MQSPPHDEGLRWLITLLAIPFAGGVGFLVKHFLGRQSALVQLNLTGAQTEVQHATAEEIRARVRREDENAVVANLRLVTQELRADVQRLREERDAALAREKMLELELRREVALRQAKELQPPPSDGKGT